MSGKGSILQEEMGWAGKDIAIQCGDVIDSERGKVGQGK
jgi:hypothetical protein